jgi:hypothetical protein
MPMTEREMRLAQEALAKRTIAPAKPVPASMLNPPRKKRSTGLRDAYRAKVLAANQEYERRKEAGIKLNIYAIEREFGLKPSSLRRWRSIRIRKGAAEVSTVYNLKRFKKS